MKFIADFNSFLRDEVNLNPNRLEKLQDAVDAISNFLAEQSDFADMYIDTIPAGSWAHRSVIKPVTSTDEFDADVLLYVTEQEGWLPKDYAENLYAAFRKSSVYRPIIKRMKRCVRIDYAGDFHVDVVPYMERGGEHYITYRLEPEDEGRFELSDPEAFTAWFEERQRITGNNFVKAVRLMKYVRDYKNTFSCKSIILKTLLGNEVNAVEASFDNTIYGDVPTTLVTLLKKLSASLPVDMPAVMDPGGTGDNFTDRYKDEWNYTNFRNMIIYYANKAEQALLEQDRDRSKALWREIFGDDFKPEHAKNAVALSTVRASVPVAGEQFIDQYPFSMAVQLQPSSSVRISARCTGLQTQQRRLKNGFRQFNLASNGNRVPKNRSLRFNARVTGVVAPYQVYWKVRNGDQEAALLGQLRGEITLDTGIESKTESTLYKGKHYVDCYVVKNSVVVARDRQIVIVGN